MKTFALAGAVAALSMAFAGAASAAIMVNFVPGPANSPTSGYTVIDDFDTSVGIESSSNIQIGTSHDGNGAPPGNSVPFDTSYLAVLGGGGAGIQFSLLTDKTVGAFEFDWGSIDGFNQLVIHYTNANGTTGKDVITPGTSSFPNLANGDQVADGTNGVFEVSATAGETFDGIVLTSSQNSFEIDNLAIAVPEPATWAMMIMGLGAIGGVLRSRRRKGEALSLA
jgi:hypothetical protein